jgi:hypothetical protein
MYVKRSATVVMTQQQYNTLLTARDIVKELSLMLEDEETIGKGFADTLDLEDLSDNLDLLADAGVIENGYVNFEVRRV